MQNALLPQLLTGAVAAYGVALVVSLRQVNLARGVAATGVFIHLVWMIWRGVLIGFVPMTNKTESFAAAAFSMALFVVLTWAPSRAYVVPQLLLCTAAGVAARVFPQELNEPSALLRTFWYPAHVPLSFLAIAAWVASASAGLAWKTSGDRTWLNRTDHLALQGLGLWSAAMICGGVWGTFAWGAYFMWDPKMIWSVILWFHYASFIHLRLTPSLQSRFALRPVLAWLGIVWILVAYVGTSFFFGKSSHAF